MAALLLLDLLGIKSRWRLANGRRHVDEAFRWFSLSVQSALAQAGAEPTGGGLESDAAALAFPSVADAVNVGTCICDQAFEHSYRESSSVKTRTAQCRFWVRGAIVSISDGTPDLVVSDRIGTLTTRRPNDSLLDALSLEQSGYKGMRLLIERALVPDGDTPAVDVVIGHGKSSGKPTYTHRVTRLKHSLYPQYQSYLSDVAWMLPRSDFSYAAWLKKFGRMQALMRWSAPYELEFAHAAATMVVFSEVDTVIRTAQRKGILVFP